LSLRLFHDPGFVAPIGRHVMPMRKFALVAEQLRQRPGFEICFPGRVTEQDLLRVHTPGYVTAMKTGMPRQLAESQKFPWSPELFSSVQLTNGAVLAASRIALKDGVSGALASGFHHAFSDHGEGFCTFNGLVIALEALRAEGFIQSAAILDLDLHYGNGTASLVESRPWIKALSIYGSDYMNNIPFRDVRTPRHSDGENHRSAAIVPSEDDGAAIQCLLDEHLPWLIEGRRPDILLSKPAPTRFVTTRTLPWVWIKRTFYRGTGAFSRSRRRRPSRWPGCWLADMLPMFKRSSGFTLTRRSHAAKSMVPHHDPLRACPPPRRVL